MTRAAPLRPYANTKTVMFINDRIERLKSVKSQRDIAFEIGYEKPNILSMIKRGEAKLPLDKVQPLAVAMGVDPLHLLRLALEDYLPSLAAAFESVIGHVATKNEWEGPLKIWREVTGNLDPKLGANQFERLYRLIRDIDIPIGPIELG